ncbi:MAG: hypothetical protein KDE33_24140, partial [Bacteroidetes bacterium]|nr:hypothetical protein [Bacteroidota bacterium]
MKRLLVILLACLYTVNVNSQCTNSVDSIITPPYIMCHKDSIHVSTVGQGFVMPGYTKFYAIFSDSICDSSHLVYFSTIPILNNLPSNLPSCGIYYYFVVVSDFNTSNSIDFNNPCLVNSNGIPFMFNKSIVSMLGGTITVPGNTGNLDCENNYVFCSDVSTFGIDACIPNTWSNIGNIQNAIANGGPCDFSPYYVYDTVVLPYCVLKTEWYDTTWLPASNAPAGCYVNGDTIFYNSDTLIFSDIHSTSPNIQVLNQPIINSSLHLQYAAVYHVIYDTLPGPCVFYVALNNCDETLMSTTIIGSIYANIDFNPPNPLQVSYAPISEPCYCGTEITIYNGVAPFVLNGNYTPDAYNPSGIITYINDTVTDLSFLTNIYPPTYWFDNLEITDLCGSSVTINGGLMGDWTYQFDFNNYYPLIQQNSCGLVDFSFSVNNSTLCGYYDFFVNDDNGTYVPCNNCSVSNGTFSYADLTEGWYYVGYSACYGDNIFVDSFEVIWSPSCDDNDCTTLDTYNTQSCMCEHTP